MAYHAQRDAPDRHCPNGDAGQLHPQRPAAGRRAPPTPTARRSTTTATPTSATPRRYKAADIQTRRRPQQEGLALPAAAHPDALGRRRATPSAATAPPSRSSSAPTAATSIEFWHTNLVPSYYELDDFQVRTPTDVIGQHIHLVKFDVTSSDGAANGFNYEDGTFSPDEVRDRIDAINRPSGRIRRRPAPVRQPDRLRRPKRTPDQLDVVPVNDAYPHAPDAGDRARPLRPAARRPGLGRCPDHHPALGHRPAARQRRAATGPCGPSSPTTTSAPRPTSRSGLYAGLLVEPEGSTVVPARRRAG